MKKKFVSIVLSALLVASLTTACGSKSEAPAAAPAPAPAAEAQTSAPEPAAETKEEEPEAELSEEETMEAEAENQEEAADGSESEGFTLLDVSTDMIEAGIYATNEDGIELVFSMFTEPSGTPMASLFMFSGDGEGDVICGAYTAETETDEDGIGWTLLTVTDVYTDEVFQIGFGESDTEVYIFDASGNPYEGEYLSADDTITYMGVAAALMEQ